MTAEGILIVGASRGVGLGLARTAARRHPRHLIFATSRKPETSRALSELKEAHGDRVVLLPLDSTDDTSLTEATKTIMQHGASLKCVWINAADYGEPVRVQEMTAEHLMDVLRTNVVGAHRCFQHFSPLVLASKAETRGVYAVSSSVGSISFVPKANPIMKKRFQVPFVPGPQYAVSKSALNMLTRAWADQLEPEGVLVATVHPTATKSEGSNDWFTKLGTDGSAGMNDALEPDDAADGMWEAIEAATPEKTAEGMLTRGGKVIPW